MSLASGTRLGPYEIIAPLGAGGAVKVWKKAQSTRPSLFSSALKRGSERRTNDPYSNPIFFNSA